MVNNHQCALMTWSTGKSIGIRFADELMSNLKSQRPEHWYYTGSRNRSCHISFELKANSQSKTMLFAEGGNLNSNRSTDLQIRNSVKYFVLKNINSGSCKTLGHSVLLFLKDTDYCMFLWLLDKFLVHDRSKNWWFAVDFFGWWYYGLL